MAECELRIDDTFIAKHPHYSGQNDDIRDRRGSEKVVYRWQDSGCGGRGAKGVTTGRKRGPENVSP